MRNPHPESSIYHEIWNDGYLAATTDFIEVTRSNCRPVRDYLRFVKGPIKVQHVRHAMTIAITGRND